MSVWGQYDKEQRNQYIKFLQVYGALTNLFRQKQGDLIPYLDSKFQETVFAKIFASQNVDIANTPHDVMSVFGDKRIGIGLKTWMGSQASYQKVMQLKAFKDEIESHRHNKHDLAYAISEIKNTNMRRDYERLGLTESDNIYHYVTRDKGTFTIHECAYPLIDLDNIKVSTPTASSVVWSDGLKDYKFSFADSQIWQKFDASKYSTLVLDKFDVRIIEDPFAFLLKAYADLIETTTSASPDMEEVYLPLYSYKTGEVAEKSGLNAWNGAPKSKGSNIPRPLNEVYIPIPREFHRKCPDFFTSNIFEVELERHRLKEEEDKPEVRFHLLLPNGKKIPALVTQDNMKALQSGSNTEIDPDTGKPFGQSALGEWLLVKVLGLKDRTLVTREWLQKKDTDSVRLWRKKGDYSLIHIDFAPIGSFDAFMNGESVEE